MFSPQFDDALTFAGLRHKGHVRKGTGAPYLTHLVHVAHILARYGYDEPTQIVGLLHDVVEDTCQNAEGRVLAQKEIEDRFGVDVARSVQSLTEPKRDAEGQRLGWQKRKEAYIAQLRVADERAVRASAADKIHNLATLILSLESEGPDLWKRFRGGPEESLWFYQSVYQVIVDRLDAEPIVEELKTWTEALRSTVEGDASSKADQSQ